MATVSPSWNYTLNLPHDPPLEEAEPARKAFGDLTEGERDVVREALVAIRRSPSAGRERPRQAGPLLLDVLDFMKHQAQAAGRRFRCPQGATRGICRRPASHNWTGRSALSRHP